MNVANTWNERPRRLFAGTTAALLVLGVAAGPAFTRFREDSARPVSVIVRELPGSGEASERAVEAVGGDVGRHIGVIDGFVARIPAGAAARVEAAASVHSVTPDRRVRLLHAIDGFDPTAALGSMYSTTKTIKAQDLWRQEITGSGVDIALIDSGVVPVNGLTAPGKIVNGPDLSFDSQFDDLRYLDAFGHGTHMAGIVAGRDDAAASPRDLTNHDNFVGVAPGARVLSLKVADGVGQTDVSQVIAAIDWVVQHRFDGGMNIRVLNLSFGTTAPRTTARTRSRTRRRSPGTGGSSSSSRRGTSSSGTRS